MRPRRRPHRRDSAYLNIASNRPRRRGRHHSRF